LLGGAVAVCFADQNTPFPGFHIIHIVITIGEADADSVFPGGDSAGGVVGIVADGFDGGVAIHQNRLGVKGGGGVRRGAVKGIIDFRISCGAIDGHSLRGVVDTGFRCEGWCGNHSGFGGIVLTAKHKSHCQQDS